MLSKDIFVPLTICIDQTRRALVIVLPCYGALEIVGVIIIIIIIRLFDSIILVAYQVKQQHSVFYIFCGISSVLSLIIPSLFRLLHEFRDIFASHP